MNTDLPAVSGLGVVPSHSIATSPTTMAKTKDGDLTGVYDPTYSGPHHELVVTTPMSTIAGKISELHLKGKIIDVTKSSTKSVLDIVIAT